ncbi:MAG: IS3 family transposase, partial [Clostridia bacterium]|nr:IS3 family transposase [Clostridia bacterium]
SRDHSVKELCEVYEVSRSGYYKWLKRKGTLNSYEKKQKELDYYVADVHSHYPSQGYRAIADTLLNQYGWVVTDVSVWKSMKRLGIHGYIRRTKKDDEGSGEEHDRYPNVLNRNFHSDAPMKKVVTDVTYIEHKNKWYYLAVYLDLFNNEILEYELGDTFDNFLVMRPAKRLLEKAKSTDSPILLHSDQGVQYSSAGYCNLLKSYNTIQSMSRAGTPRDNAVIESFFGRFKDVMSSHFQYWKCDDIRKVVDDTVYYFNFIRPVRKLNKKPPVQFRIDLSA